MENWYRLTEVQHSAAHTITAKAELPVNSPWFSGHFPGEPILPGVAQIALVMDSLRQGLGRDLKVTGIRRTRFKQIIRPGETLEIEIDVKDDPATSASFRIFIRGDVACSGTVTTI